MKNNFTTETLVQNIQSLCDAKKISVNQMLRECGLGKSVIDNLKRGYDPRLSSIVTIAGYFDTTVDILISCSIRSISSKEEKGESRMKEHPT